jgi:hypothetical protein
MESSGLGKGQWQALVNKLSGFVKGGEFLDKLRDHYLLKDSAPYRLVGWLRDHYLLKKDTAPLLHVADWLNSWLAGSLTGPAG